jgi:hypothetical protein
MITDVEIAEVAAAAMATLEITETGDQNGQLDPVRHYFEGAEEKIPEEEATEDIVQDLNVASIDTQERKWILLVIASVCTRPVLLQ